jgi:hypothetical protein
MAGLAKYIQWLWLVSVALQVLVCTVLFLKGNYRRLPIFTAYVLSNICQAAALYLTYEVHGFRTEAAIVIGWSSQGATQVFRVLATTEVIRLILKPYRGIWGLGWRVLMAAFGVVFSVTLIDAGRGLQWTIGLADRGFHLAFGIALVACLLLVHYYRVPIHPVYKALLGGFCFYSCTAVLANTTGRFLFLRGYGDFGMGWQLVTMSAYMSVLLVWLVALRMPLPQPARGVILPEAERAYWEISPRINERLRALNERLDNFWNSEATQS